MEKTEKLKLYLAKYEQAYEKEFEKLKSEKVIDRIWNMDHTVWNENPDEISNRLGWLDSPQNSLDQISEIESFISELKKDELNNVVLLGMGGSSLAPEVFRKIFGVKYGWFDVTVLDSTDPGAVLNIKRNINPNKTVFIVSTKSGGTVETISFMKYFFNWMTLKQGKENVYKHFVAITDPGSGLQEIAENLNFRKIFLNDPNIGGRYSALSLFGIVPATLLGIEVKNLLGNALEMTQNNKLNDNENMGAVIGSVLGALYKLGKDKLTFVMSDSIANFGSWIEQLIAESTGKNGKGILPVVDEDLLAPEFYTNDRIFVNIKSENDTTNNEKVENLIKAGFPVIELNLESRFEIGGQFLLWEMATVIAGWSLGIQPYDQPNVESAKIQARKMMQKYTEEGKLPVLSPALFENGIKVFGEVETTNLKDSLIDFLNKFEIGKSYLSIQAYINPTEEVETALQNFRTLVQKKYKIPVTTGFGPRFLHSTGQLHKGDSGNGLFIQLTANMPEDLNIPENAGEEGSLFSFAILKDAQALGDRQALLDNKRKFIRYDLGDNVIESINILSSAL